LTVDEQLQPFRGRYQFRQYKPSKPAKYSVKWWLCCDAGNSYICDLDVYSGRSQDGQPSKRVGEGVVTKFMAKFKGSGRNATMDNFFTSVLLAKSLLQDNITVTGTTRKNKQEIPSLFQPSRNRPVESSLFGFDGALPLVSYVPKKNRAVILLSTMHHGAVINADNQNKPEVILDYNSTKGGVDTANQLIRTYFVKRKVNRWPAICFFNLIDMAALNAMNIWILKNPRRERNKRFKRRLFLKQLAKSPVAPWINKQVSCEQSGLVRHAILAAGFQIVSKLKHEQTGIKRRCYLCGKKKNRKTNFSCSTCYKPICLSHSSATAQYTCECCFQEQEKLIAYCLYNKQDILHLQ
jgi:hypothetical protein